VISALRIEVPVTLLSGRARLATSPVPTGSAAPTKTIGMLDVAFIAAMVGGEPGQTMMSGLSATSSAARAGSRSVLPRAYRAS